MKKLLSIAALLFSLFVGAQAQAQGQRPADMTASGAIVGTQIVWCPVGTTSDRKCTFTQVAAYINSLVSGDCTANGTGTFTCTKTNGSAFGALATQVPGTNVATWIGTPSSANLAAALTDETGSGAAVFGTAPTISSLNASVAMTLAFLTGAGTQCVQVSNTGVVSGTGSACGGSGSTGANPTATASDTAVNGSATTFLRSDGAPPVQKATTGQFGIVKPDGVGIGVSGGVISNLGVTSVSTGCGAAGGPIVATGTISASMPYRINTAASGVGADFVAGDCGGVVADNRATSVAASLPAPATTGFGSGAFFERCNINTGVATITPVSGTIGGASSYALAAGTAAAPTCVGFQSDGTNYNLVSIPTAAPSGSAGGDLSGTYPNPSLSFASASAAAAASDTDTFPTNQGAGTLKQTLAAIKTWVKGWIAKADVGLGNVANVDTTNAANISSGALPLARIGTGAANHAVPVDVAGTSTYKVIPDCTDTGGNHINYTQASDAFSCGTSGGGGSNTEPFPRPAYITGGTQWYLPQTFSNGATGAAASANTIKCTFGGVPNLVTVKALAVRMSTAGSTNVQIAVYQDNAGVPGTLLGSTANIVNTGSTGPIQGNVQVSAVDTPIQIGPGGSVGNDKIWWCTNSGDGTVVMQGLSTSTSFPHAALIGSATIGNLLSVGTTITGKACVGAGCQGGSSTFGTWPADLHTSTFVDVNNATAPMVAFLVN